MPRVCEFYGIAIYVYYGEHGPPHFHARHAGREMSRAMEDLSILVGRLTPRATGMVAEWAALRRIELRRAWQQARASEPIDRIEPLR